MVGFMGRGGRTNKHVYCSRREEPDPPRVGCGGRSNPQLQGGRQDLSHLHHPGQHSQRLGDKAGDSSSSATGGHPATAAVTGREGTLRAWGHLGQMIHIKICPWEHKAVKRTVLSVLSARELKNHSKKESRTEPSPGENQAPHPPCYTTKILPSKNTPEPC